MPPRKAVQPSDPPGALLVLLEVGEDRVISDEYKYMVKKLIADRIFTNSEDVICVTSIGAQNSNTYSQASWKFLKKVMDELEKPEIGTDTDIIAEIQNAIESVAIQAEEANCEEMKLILLGQFEKNEFKRKYITDLQNRCAAKSVSVTFGFPKKEEFGDVQTKNYEVIERVIDEFGEGSFICISDVVASIAQLANKIAEIPKKPMSYKFTLKIGSDIFIPVKKWLANREEKPSWNKYKKEREHITSKTVKRFGFPSASDSTEQALTPSASASELPEDGLVSSTSASESPEETLVPSNSATDSLEEPSTSAVATKPLIIGKEVKYVTSKGEEVEKEEELHKGYLYGGEIVREEETAGTVVEPTEQCLELLVFCPKNNIPPVCFLGDGTDIYLPQESEDAKAKFYALLEALEARNTVAIVRFVWRKNAAPKMLALMPDKARKGLISVHLCYADDASIPSFVPLIKEADIQKPPNNQDQLIDQLIQSMDISDFHPETGPMSPAIIKFRDEVTNKVLYESGKRGDNVVRTRYNTIDIMFPYFEEVSEDLIDKLKDAFPVTQKKTPNDVRPSGQNIFRKRHGSADFEADDEKKLKLDDDLSDEPMEALVQQNQDELLEDL